MVLTRSSFLLAWMSYVIKLKTVDGEWEDTSGDHLYEIIEKQGDITHPALS